MIRIRPPRVGMLEGEGQAVVYRGDLHLALLSSVLANAGVVLDQPVVVTCDKGHALCRNIVSRAVCRGIACVYLCPCS